MIVVPQQQATTTRAARPHSPFGAHVASEIEQLQARWKRKDSAIIATMARLRASVNRPVGYEYSILACTAVPEKYIDRPTDETSPEERAKHATLGLYALHQQSEYERDMHRRGFAFGRAISLLGHATGAPEAVRRRFTALGTASGFDEAMHHLRGLVQQLRGEHLAIDYGLLAHDLLMLQKPDGPSRIRAIWGREYARAEITHDRTAVTELEDAHTKETESA